MTQRDVAGAGEDKWSCHHLLSDIGRVPPPHTLVSKRHSERDGARRKETVIECPPRNTFLRVALFQFYSTPEKRRPYPVFQTMNRMKEAKSFASVCTARAGAEIKLGRFGSQSPRSHRLCGCEGSLLTRRSGGAARERVRCRACPGAPLGDCTQPSSGEF